MAAEQSMRKCAHDRCVCQVYEGQTYCGPHCASAAVETGHEDETGRCECGHTACAAQHPVGMIT